MGRANLKTAKAIIPLRAWLTFAVSVMFAAILSVSANAAVRLVNNQPGCSDSSGNPYCTINAAVAAAVANDTVSVAPGSYSGKVTVTHSGTLGVPFAISASPGVTLTSTTQGFDLSGVSWVTINGFTVNNTTNEGFRCTLCSNVTLSNNKVTNSTGSGFFISNSSNTVLSNNQVEDSRGIGIDIAGSTAISVLGGYVTRSGLPSSGNTRNGIRFSTSSASLVDGTQVYENTDNGVFVINGSNGIRIKRVIAHHNARVYNTNASGIEFQSAGNIVESSISYQNEDSGINMRFGGADGLMVNNVTYLNGDHGIDVLESPRPVIVNNTVYKNTTSGINIEGGSVGGIVHNNISVDNALVDIGRKRGNINIGNSSAPANQVDVDYNLVSACCGSPLYVYLGTTYSTVAGLPGAVELNGIQALPGWADTANNDFHLAAGSPAIDSAKSDAIATTEINQDLEGNARCDNPSAANTGTGPISYMDRGPYEFAASCAGPDTTPPSVPAGLAGTGFSPTRIDLTWTASTDNVAVTGYKVFRNGGSTEIATVTGTTFSDTGRTPNNTYTYTVSAFDAANNNSAQSSSVPVTTPLTDTVPPSVPAGLAGTAISPTQINLTWTAATDNVAVTGYNVYRNGGTTAIATVTGTSFSDTGLTPNTTYSYEVSAVDAASNNSTKTPAISVATLADSTAPTVPTNLNGTAVSQTEIDLTWTASTDNVAVTGYKVFRGTAEIATVTGTSFNDTGLTANTTYSYAVLAFDAADNSSAQTAAIPVTTPASSDSTPPSQPTGLAGTPSLTQIDLTWEASSDNVAVTGYKVFRNSAEIATVTGTSFSNTGLTANTTYSYAVLAFDAAGNNSDQSTAISVTTLADTENPSVPTGLGGSAASQTQINLSWTASNDNVGVNGYKVFRDSVEIATVTGTTFNNTGLTADTTYSYAVSAFDATGNESVQSSAISVTTPPAVTTITWEARVSASANDAEQIVGGSTNLTSSDLELVLDASLQVVGLRLTNVTVPRNATITNAYVQFTTDEVSTAAVSLSLAGEAADNSAIFTTAANNISNRPKTAATASWSPAAWNTINEAGANQRTPNLAAAIQQIVNRAGWSSGNALSIIISGSGKRVARAFDTSSGTQAPLLHIEYTAPAGGDSVLPSVPTNLSGSAVSQTQIDLTWTASTDNVGVTGYKVFRNSAEIATVTGTSFSNTGLTANTTYSYAVSAFDAAGNNSAQTSAISVSTPPASSTVTWQARVSASANDAEEFIGGTSTDLSSTDLEIVTDGTTLQLVGLRFTGLTIPRNSVITNAYIQFTVDEASSDATTLSLAAEAVDNSAIFTTADNNISNRVKTAATASWTPPAWNTIDEAGINQRTPNLSAVVQQIVNRAGWASGNALSIIVTGSGKRVARAFNISGGAKAPLLLIEYTPP